MSQLLAIRDLYCVILLVKNMKLSLSILVALLVIATCSAKPAFEEVQGVAGAGCSVPEVYLI